MIRKSVQRFSEKIMLKQKVGAAEFQDLACALKSAFCPILDSGPCISRLMLALCSAITKTAPHRQSTMKGIAAGSNRYISIGAQPTAIIDARETYLDNQTIARKMANAQSAAGKFIAIIAPSPVAALLPPRQLRKMDLL